MWTTLALLVVGLDPGGRFRAEYPREVAALRREFTDVRGTATVRQVLGSRIGPPATVQFACSHGAAKCEADTPSPNRATPPGRPRNVICRDENSCFRLTRSTVDGPYSIVAIGDDDQARVQFDGPFGKYLDAPWSIAGFEILFLMNSDRFRIIESRDLTEEGRSLVEVVFESGHATQEIDVARVVFDPAFHWAIVRAEFRAGYFNGRVLERTNVNYSAGPSNSRFIHDVRLVDFEGEETLCEFGPVEFVATPASEFTLAHYGLNDPRRKPRLGGSAPIWVAILTLAAGLLCLGWWLARRARRSMA